MTAGAEVQPDLIDQRGRIWEHIPDVDCYRHGAQWCTREQVDADAGPVMETR